MKYATILFIVLFAYGLLPAQPGIFDAKEEHSYVQKYRIESVKIYQVERDMATDNIHNRQLTSVRYFDENGHLREVQRFEEDGTPVVIEYRFDAEKQQRIPLSETEFQVKTEQYTDSLGRKVDRKTMPHLAIPDMTMTTESILDEETGALIENMYNGDELFISMTGVQYPHSKVLHARQPGGGSDTLYTNTEVSIDGRLLFMETRHKEPNPFMGQVSRSYWVYDDLGRIVATFSFSRDGEQVMEGRYRYHENGFLENSTQKMNGEVISQRDNTFDEEGLMLSSVEIKTNSFTGESRTKEMAYEYTFYSHPEEGSKEREEIDQ